MDGAARNFIFVTTCTFDLANLSCLEQYFFLPPYARGEIKESWH